MDIAEVLDNLVEVEATNCLEWQRAKARGYGIVSFNGKMQMVHRVVYEHLIGPIPEGLQIDHLCRNRACSNPGHLDPVTARTNINRGRKPQSEKTHCPKGHPYDQANTYYRKDRPGRECRLCSVARNNNRNWQKLRALGIPVRRKISDEQIDEIRRTFTLGLASKAQMSRQYSISRTHVGRILKQT